MRFVTLKQPFFYCDCPEICTFCKGTEYKAQRRYTGDEYLQERSEEDGDEDDEEDNEDDEDNDDDEEDEDISDDSD